MLSIAQHGDAIGQLENLLQAVADVDDADAALPKTPDHVEEHAHLGRVKRGGRLVHDHQRSLERDGARQRHHLLQRHAQVHHRHAEIDVHAQPVEQLLRRAAHARPVDPAPASARLAPQKDVFGGGQVGDQVDLLVDGGDTGGLGLGGRMERDVLAPHEDTAIVLRIGAGQDLDEGGLAGAVMPYQRVDLAMPDVEVNAGQRLHAGEALGDAAHLKQRVGSHDRPCG